MFNQYIGDRKLKIYWTLNLVFFIFGGWGCESPCVLNSQCGSQQVCSAGQCLNRCTSYFECAQGEACYEGACQIPPAGFCALQGRQSQTLMSDGGVENTSTTFLCDPSTLPDQSMMDTQDSGVDFEMREMDLGMDQGPANLMRKDQLLEDQMIDLDLNDQTMDQEFLDQEGLDQGELDQDILDQDLLDQDLLDQEPLDQDILDQDSSNPMVRPNSQSPWLFTLGNEIRIPGQGQWRGRGVNLHDTRSCGACVWIPPNPDEVLRRIDTIVDEWGANFIRLNLESYATSNGRVNYRPLVEDDLYVSDLERIVDYIGQKPNVYVLLSIYRDPSLNEQGWPTSQTHALLRRLVRSFYDDPQVIFGVSHEPQDNLNGIDDQACWTAMNDAVEAIRSEERLLGPYRHLIAVQATRDRGRDLAYYIDHPIEANQGENIIYETHIFNSQAEFNRLLVQPAQTLPVILGAFGPNEGTQTAMNQTEAIALIAEAELQNVPWTAWTFHMRCQPAANMLIDASQNGCGIDMALQPTEWGQVVQGQLQMHQTTTP